MKFGVREICNVTFKAADDIKIGTSEFVKYQPVFMIDTAQTSEMSQESTTVYAQGGRGYNRLIAWEGEKTMTFTVTDALMSPMGMSVLSGAGLIKANKDNKVHVHLTMTATAKAGDSDNTVATIKAEDIADELGIILGDSDKINICNDITVYGTKIDGSGAGIGYVKGITIAGKDSSNQPIASGTSEKVIPLGKGDVLTFTSKDATAVGAIVYDFYVVMTSGATEIIIEPDSFGGYFYVEADTLFRREDSGKDMAATLTFPRVKVQSAFKFSMAASGDPSTFDFTMDAFPGYTQFDSTKKVCVTMAIVGADKEGSDNSSAHTDHPGLGE